MVVSGITRFGSVLSGAGAAGRFSQVVRGAAFTGSGGKISMLALGGGSDFGSNFGSDFVSNTGVGCTATGASINGTGSSTLTGASTFTGASTTAGAAADCSGANGFLYSRSGIKTVTAVGL